MATPVLAQIQTDQGVFALAVAALVAIIYLAVIRFMDLNEKEPVWALALALQQGFLVAIFLPLFTTPEIDQSLILQPLATEVARFIALGVAVAILAAVSRARGWSEISGPMDGVVYGATVGLGFAVGTAFFQELAVGGRATTMAAGTFSLIWTTALAGLIHGLFGAIMGAGFGAAMRSRSGGRAAGYVALGFVGAFAAHVLYLVLRTVGGPGGIPVFRTWIALAIPVVLVAAVMVAALRQERRAIHEQLEDERQTGAVTDEELALLRSFGARRAAYASAFFRADFDYWLALRSLHNRQVQLALAKQRASGDVPADERAELEGEAARLRADVIGLREIAGARRGRRGAREGA